MFEEYADFLGVLVILTGTIMALGYFPQAYKIFKRKSSADISLPAFVVFWIGAFIWFVYGLSINNLPIIIATAVGVIAISIVIVAYFKYKK